MRRALVLILLASGIIIVAGQAAHGCSCFYGDPRDRLADADGAFVGRLIAKEEPTPGSGGLQSSAQPVTYTFEVERSVKGDLGRTVEVESAAYGASCGFEVAKEERVGVLLQRVGGEWRSGLCGQMDPDVLIEASKPLPKPTGSGPARFVIGGRVEGLRLISLDRSGRTLAHGRGDGEAVLVSVCPGGLRVLEVDESRDDQGTRSRGLSVRDVASLRIVSRRTLSFLTHQESVDALRCLDQRGSSAYLFATEYGEPRSSGRILRVGSQRPRTIYSGDATGALFQNDQTVFATAGRRGDDIVRIDLRSGRARTIAKGTGGLARSLSISPDGTRLAGLAGDWALEPDATKLVLVDMRRSPALVRKVVIGERDLYGPTAWYGNERIVVAPGDGTIRIFDARLQRRSTFKGWSERGGGFIVVEGRMLYGCSSGWVGSAELPDGPVRTLRRFASPQLYAFAVLPAVQTKPAPKPTETPMPSPESPTPGPETPSPPAPVQALPPNTSAAAQGMVRGAASLMVLLIGAAWWFMGRRHRSRGAG